MVKRLCYVSFPAHKETGADNRTNEGIRVDGRFVNSSGGGWKRKMSKGLKVYRRGLDDEKTKQEGGERGGGEDVRVRIGGCSWVGVAQRARGC